MADETLKPETKQPAAEKSAGKPVLPPPDTHTDLGVIVHDPDGDGRLLRNLGASLTPVIWGAMTITAMCAAVIVVRLLLLN